MLNGCDGVTHSSLCVLQEVMAVKRAHRRAAKLARLARINETHCSAQPICGSDLHHAVDVLDPRNEGSTARVPGYVQCANVHTCSSGDMNVFWRQTRALRRLVHTPGQYLEELTEILNRLVMVISCV